MQLSRNKIGFLLIILLFIVLLVNITSNNNDYSVSNSKFQLPNGWSNLKEASYGTNKIGFGYGDTKKIFMVIEQCKDENEFISEYSSYSQFGSAYNVTTSTKTINGTEIKVFKTIHNISPNLTTTDYYFQKNGKYYRIYFDDYRTNKDQSVINTAIEKVFSTLN